MKVGDFVRFRNFDHMADPDRPKEKIGLLIEYEPWQKVATVLYEGKTLRLRANDVEKAGKKDFEKR